MFVSVVLVLFCANIEGVFDFAIKWASLANPGVFRVGSRFSELYKLIPGVIINWQRCLSGVLQSNKSERQHGNETPSRQIKSSDDHLPTDMFKKNGKQLVYAEMYVADVIIGCALAEAWGPHVPPLLSVLFPIPQFLLKVALCVFLSCGGLFAGENICAALACVNAAEIVVFGDFFLFI